MPKKEVIKAAHHWVCCAVAAVTVSDPDDEMYQQALDDQTKKARAAFIKALGELDA
jgi:hypothetical protein